jgi:hypothetical protein
MPRHHQVEKVTVSLQAGVRLGSTMSSSPRHHQEVVSRQGVDGPSSFIQSLFYGASASGSECTAEPWIITALAELVRNARGPHTWDTPIPNPAYLPASK